MAILFDDKERVVPTWLAAAKHLEASPGRKAMNLVLEIAEPLAVTDEDKALMQQVDGVLAAKDLTLRTVAGTIFPLDLYRRYGRPGFYEKYKAMLKRGKKRGTWGTYALRMIDRTSKDCAESINPLDMLINRLRTDGQPQKQNGQISSFTSAYELGVSDPAIDLDASYADEAGGEVPTYNAAIDGREWMGMPCLSHLSFKRVDTDDGYAVNLTAMYRSHHYCARALGNLLGLAQLLSFVAKEAELKVGTLTCLSSHAVLDVDMWGGVRQARAILGLPPSK
ncbi:hypothetical protein DOT66_13215 [Ralstonia pseudosolanacearum]|uniref:hypothetical protein n=1 Tax=Ralstonia pseudosolanacearum TaxID=1310165 RepID=UPI000DABCC90|nr:hypothetical protein [Ralstonia pseudosolanacearum]MCK4136115.1 hypothetical protein [Ralstonia pseudosolanacearum]RAA09138.1 hypothetical protein DOT66_13215 [Ralstonia pseudosolanacearum]UQY82600.1 hypothetical protein JNO62_00075 [Ralstonia pseudosolanacearum]